MQGARDIDIIETEDTVIEFQAQVEGERIDKLVVARVPELSRSAVQKMIRGGLVTVNGKEVKSNYRARLGDPVVVRVPPGLLGEAKGGSLRVEPIPLDVVYEDDWLLVVNKPAGMVVHPAFGHDSGTLVNAVLAHVPGIEDAGQPERPGIVHRLDMETSGLIVVAKNGEVRSALQEEFKERRIKKSYLALVEGQVTAGNGIIEAAIGRDPRRRKRMSVMAGGRPAVTHYRVLERFEGNTYLELELHTGRTHQIRVHLAYIGHPVVGDPVYGYRKQRHALQRQFLHATRLGFRHPCREDTLDFMVPLPDDLQRVLDELREGR